MVNSSSQLLFFVWKKDDYPFLNRVRIKIREIVRK